jgi:hypothetical protein
MAQKKRKVGRPPGSRKKPQPVVAARLSPQTRMLLETAALKNKRTLSAEITARLDYAFARYRKGGKADDVLPHIRALLDAVEVTARMIETATGRRWHENRFTGVGLVRAIGLILAELAPDADEKIPPKVIERAKTHIAGKKYVTRFGEEEARGIIAWFDYAQVPQAEEPPIEFLEEFRKVIRATKRRQK